LSITLIVLKAVEKPTFSEYLHSLNERSIDPTRAIANWKPELEDLEEDDSDNVQLDYGSFGIVWDNRKTSIEAVSLRSLRLASKEINSPSTNETFSFRKGFYMPSIKENKFAAGYMFVDAIREGNE
jgi:hypothetical protein